MTLEFNIFDIYEQPNIDSNEVQDINLIEKIHEERDITSLSISDPLEVPSMMNNYFLRRYNFDGTTQFMNYINDAHYSYVAEWILKKKVFKCTKNKKKIHSNIKASIFKLKPLPENLKYAFQEPKETFLVVISVHRDEN